MMRKPSAFLVCSNSPAALLRQCHIKAAEKHGKAPTCARRREAAAPPSMPRANAPCAARRRANRPPRSRRRTQRAPAFAARAYGWRPRPTGRRPPAPAAAPPRPQEGGSSRPARPAKGTTRRGGLRAPPLRARSSGSGWYASTPPRRRHQAAFAAAVPRPPEAIHVSFLSFAPLASSFSASRACWLQHARPMAVRSSNHQSLENQN